MADEETPKQRDNRELNELLQELRVAITGVQVLFAFLLTVPVSSGYQNFDTGERRLLFAAIVTTALASLLLIAPAASHRLLFRVGKREELLNAANRVVIVGFAVLGLGMALSIYLVSTFVYGGVAAVVTTSFVTVVTAFFWFVFPRVLR